MLTGDPKAASKLCSKLPEVDVAEDNEETVSKPKVGLVNLITENVNIEKKLGKTKCEKFSKLPFRAKLCSTLVVSVMIQFLETFKISRKNIDFFTGEKTRENVAVFHYLAVDHFDFPRKICQFSVFSLFRKVDDKFVFLRKLRKRCTENEVDPLYKYLKNQYFCSIIKICKQNRISKFFFVNF